MNLFFTSFLKHGDNLSRPTISNYFNIKTMSANFLLRGPLTMIVSVISGSSYAQTLMVNSISTASGYETIFSNNSWQANALSKKLQL